MLLLLLRDVCSRNEGITKLLPSSLSELAGVMGIAEIIERLPSPPSGIPPSLTEEMGMMKIPLKDTADEGETNVYTSPNVGKRRGTYVGLSKSSTTGKTESRRPLSVSLPLSPLSQTSDGFQLQADGVYHHKTIAGTNPSEDYGGGTKEQSKG